MSEMSEKLDVDPGIKPSRMSKLRARMQSFRANAQPACLPSELITEKRTVDGETGAASQSNSLESAKPLQSHSEAPISQQQAQYSVRETPEAADGPPATLDPSRTSGSSWDRRFRQISTTMLKPSAQFSAPVPTVKKEPAAQEADMLQQTARGIAELRHDPDLGTQNEDPWSWDLPKPAETGLKKRQAPSFTRAAAAPDALPVKKKAKMLTSTKPPSHCSAKVADHHTAAENAAACPDLSNAPTHGPDEPLLLEHSEDDAGGEPLHLSVPASINMYLRDYQREGVRFLFRQYAQHQGGILGDDMGLGKTVQTIAFCAALLGKTGSSTDSTIKVESHVMRCPILIVAPTSVLTNWQREFATWGAFSVGLCHGRHGVRDAMLQGVQHGQFEIMLTSYDTFRLNLEDMLRVSWHVAIFDEAHKLKNPKAKIYEACCRLKTKLRYGLTGTAMQNDYDELYTLLDWAAPGRLGDKDQFRDYYEAPIKMAQKKNIHEEALGKGRARQTQLNQLVEKFLLRRTKDNTIKGQLPKKTDNIVFCEMSLLQHRAYERTLDSPDFQLLVHFDELCSCGSGTWRASCCFQTCDAHQGGVLWPQFHCCQCDSAADAFTNPGGCKWHKPEGCSGPYQKCPFCLMLPCLTILQKISNHLELVKGNPLDQQDRDVRRNMKFERDTAVAEMVLGDDLDKVGGAEADHSFMTLSDTSSCGKLTALDKLLDLWYSQDNANKVLVFSHSVRMLDIIERLIIMSGYVYLRLDGSTKQQDRQGKVDQFNSSPSVFLFLISTTAGGLGLNLTAANRVVIVDPSWNPAHDLQAQDRAFRIGQRRDVGVYRLVSTGTLEEMVYARQIYKQQASNTAIEGSRERRYFEGVKGVKGHEGELWGLANLFKLTAETVATRDIITATDRRELNYSIEAFDADDAVQEPETSTSAVPNLEAEADDLEVEDPGLYDLARRLTDNALQGEASLSPGPHPTAPVTAQHDRARLPIKDEPEEVELAALETEPDGGDKGHAPSGSGVGNPSREMLVLQEGGMLATHQHETILGGSTVEQMLSNAAEQRAARFGVVQQPSRSTAGRHNTCAPVPPEFAPRSIVAGGHAQTSSQEPSAVALLAAWKNLTIEQMAKVLLDMTPGERTHLREQYAGL